MNATGELQALGQSLWLDNITRELLDDGVLAHYIKDLSVTGLTSNPTIFQKAIEDTHLYDSAIDKKARAGKSGEALFFELAIEDLRRAADHGQVDGVLADDGGDCQAVLDQFEKAGIDQNALATQLQDEGAKSFEKSWGDLLECIAS